MLVQKEKFNMQKFINIICSFSPRLGGNEIKTCNYIKDCLNDYNVKFSVQGFKNSIPIYKKVRLMVNGKNVECKGSTFESGKFGKNVELISSFSDSKFANINYNSHCKDISQANFYLKPAISIKRSDAKRVRVAKALSGDIVVKKFDFESANILVGNIKNPKVLIFAHYDCIGKGGAVDNASGVAVLLYLVINYPDLLEDNLIVFIGSEELSYDKYRYDGFGFRVFEKKYKRLIEDCKRIYVVDGVGLTKSMITQELSILNEAFQLKSLAKYTNKVNLIMSDYDAIMKVYHSDKDVPKLMHKKYLLGTVNLLREEIEK